MKAHTIKPTEDDDTRRAHIVVPVEVLQEVDALVGPRRRSEFFISAVREKLERERLRRLAHQVAGSLKDSETPGWETPEAASAWVRDLREESERGRLSHRTRV